VSDVTQTAISPTLGPTRVGVRAAGVALLPATEAQAVLGEIEDLGYGTFWFSEGPKSKDALTYAALLLSWSSHLTVAAGIASIYARDAFAMSSGAHALAEAYPGRFVLGLGVSHAPLVQRRGHTYRSPLTAMREYLDAMAEAQYAGAMPTEPLPVVLGALQPKMLSLAGERTRGAHPYFVPVAHTVDARSILGPGPLLAPDQAVVLDSDLGRARGIANEFATVMLRFENYRRSLIRLGYSESELTGEPSDRVVDDLVAWGDADRIAARVKAHLDAGADHVSVQVLTPGREGVPLAELRELAPALLAL
jgi:probable F420-dependent oxidoreductase